MENYAKLTQPTYREIGHYFGHSSDGRTPLGGRRFKGSHSAAPLFFPRRELITTNPKN